MRRIQGNFGETRDPEEERKRVRESVLASAVLFTSFVVAIRIVPFIINSM